MCEVIEHLNFNPLPVLKEINRILHKDGFLYIGMPNQARILNRIRLLLGKSIHDSIDHYFRQLDKNDNMIVGLHWREYTLDETVEMTERLGFRTVRKYLFVEKYNTRKNIKTLLASLAYTIPSLRPFQVIIGQKVADPAYDFWLTEASS